MIFAEKDELRRIILGGGLGELGADDAELPARPDAEEPLRDEERLTGVIFCSDCALLMFFLVLRLLLVK